MKTTGSTFLNTLDFLDDRRWTGNTRQEEASRIIPVHKERAVFPLEVYKEQTEGARVVHTPDSQTRWWNTARTLTSRAGRLVSTTQPRPNRDVSLSRSDGEQKIAWKEGRRRKGGGSRGLNRKLWGSIIGEPRSSTVNQGLLLSSRKFRGEGRRERGDKRRRLIPREHFVRSENWWTWSRCAIAFINLT